jgi:hypothetical protein
MEACWTIQVAAKVGLETVGQSTGYALRGSGD